MSRTAVLAFVGMLVACMPTMKQRQWEVRLIGSADSVQGSYLSGDTKSAEGHTIRAALPFRIAVVGGTMAVSALNGSRAGDTLRVEIWEGGKLRRSAVGRAPREHVSASAID